MKPILYSLASLALVILGASCNGVNYQKTKSGLLYKIMSSNSKDSTVKNGEYLKLHFTQKINDSVLQTSFGKMPAYVKVAMDQAGTYNPAEIFHLLRKGDSVVTVAITDSLLKKGIMPELPPFMKKGDRLTTSFKVVDVIRDDSVYRADAEMEATKDRPRQMKEQEEQALQMQNERKMLKEKEELEYEKSGEAARGIQAMEEFLKKNNINATKTGKGTFVRIQEQGSGPQADSGKYVTVKYAGKFLDTDSVFQENSYTLKLDETPVITGWHEGLKLFKQGGKGTLFVPGFLAYGKNPPQNSPFKQFEPLKFDVEIVSVSDTMPEEMKQMPQRRN